MTRTIRLLGFLLLLASTSFSQSSRDQVLQTPFRAGVAHVDGKYGFTQDNFLLEGSRRISDSGSDAIFIYLEPQFRSRYPDKTNAPFWPAGDLRSMTELAKTAPYKAVFAMPFKTFVITAYSFATQGDVLNFATNPGLAAVEEQEFYELTRYLLTTYAGTGKTFILKNWEGDYIGLRGFDATKDISSDMIDAMNIWLKARQRGISRARADSGNPAGVGVFHAVEMSRVLDYSRLGLTRVVNAVVPVVKPDMVAYSSYDSTLGGSDAASAAASINEALNTIKHFAPDPLGLGNKRIIISEYGLFENEHSDEEIAWRTKTILETAQAAGVFGAFLWQVFDNECLQSNGSPFPTDASPGDALRPSNSDCRGLWLVKPDGGESKTKPVVSLYWKPTSGITVTGQVTSAATGSGIAGAKVSFYGGETTADGSGNYQLANVPAKSTQLTASASGYQNYSKTIAVGAQNIANFALIPSTAAGSVSGRVTSAINGAALSGVTVKYSGGSTTTDSMGAFKFAAIVGGTYDFTAQLAGWVPVVTRITVQPAVNAVMNLRLATGAKLTGRVSNSAGSPLAGARVNLHGGLVPTNITVSADSNGNYDSGWVAIGSYQATASATNYAPSSASVTLTTGVVSTQNFVLGTGQPDFTLAASPVTQTLTAGQATTFMAQVTPVQGFSNAVSLSVTGVPASATASFNPAAIASGSSTLSVTTNSTTPAGTYTLTISANGGGVQHTAQVSLIVKSVVTTGSITGRITSAINGAALSGATVSYSGGSTTSDANGYYKFNSVPAGTYTVTAQKSGWVAASTTATVASGSAATANIRLATGGKIAGKVVNRSGVAISGATIKMTGGLVATSITVTTGSTGTYTSPWIAIGSYTVQASKSGYTTQNKTITVSTGGTTTVNFTMQ